MTHRLLVGFQTPKRTTERLLANSLVYGSWVDVRAADLVFELLERYAPNVEVELVNCANFPNPVITSRFPWVPLGVALKDICRLCFVTVDVSDRGAVTFHSETVEDQLKRATLVEAELHKARYK